MKIAAPIRMRIPRGLRPAGFWGRFWARLKPCAVRSRCLKHTVCAFVAVVTVGVAETRIVRAQEAESRPAQVLDSVVAVVNRHVILSSDIDEEIRLSILDPVRGGQGVLTRRRALDQLISRTFIEQQIRREEAKAAEPSAEEMSARLEEIRKELPACVRENCASDAGWKAFLAAHDLTLEQVEGYLRYRLEILSFIEQRFRPGIHISQQDIESYYRSTLLPQYAPGESVPALDTVAPRIEEILLQQQVNVLFDEWLTNLRKQGDVEILDPALEPAVGGDGAESKPDGRVGTRRGEGMASQ